MKRKESKEGEDKKNIFDLKYMDVHTKKPSQKRKKKKTGNMAWVFLRRNTNTTFGIVHFFFYRDSLREEKKEQTGS